MFHDPGHTLEHIIQNAVMERYQFYRGNKTQTANSLGITTKTLDTKIEKYEADQKDRKVAYEELKKRRMEQLGRERGSANQFHVASSISAVPNPFASMAVMNESPKKIK